MTAMILATLLTTAADTAPVQKMDLGALPVNTWVKMPLPAVARGHRLVLRGWTSLTYDPTSKCLVWFVADETERRIYSNCLWFYDPDRHEWTSEPHPYPVPNPEAKDAMVYRADHPMPRHPYRGNGVDPAANVFVQFGGVGYGQWQNDTWQYDLAKGTWQDMKPAVHPPTEGMNAMVYVPELTGLLAHGGAIGASPAPLTWLYTPTNNTWKDLKAANTPRGSDHTLVYDAKTRACITFTFGKAWIYDVRKNTWAMVEGPGPVARYHEALACARDQGIVVLHGGRGKPDAPRARVKTVPTWAAPVRGVLSDTWLLNTATKTWIDLGAGKDLDPNKGQPIRACWDPVRKAVFGIGVALDGKGPVAMWAFRPAWPKKAD